MALYPFLFGSYLLLLFAVDNMEILPRRRIDLNHARHGVAAVSGRVPGSRWNEGHIPWPQAILLPLHDGSHVSFEHDVDILGLRVVVRRPRTRVDVDQIDMDVHVLGAILFI